MLSGARRQASILAFLLCLTSAPAGAEDRSVAEHTNVLEEIVGTKIYTASKKEEDLDKSPSAAYVITEEDLKRLGVRHIADALQTVPGLQVAKITSNKWMVASRGFGEQFSNKLLVLVDSRPIYNALFSGVLWYQENVPIQDIKQIEVIRGPGAVMWGSNAVNGVINIITKSSRNTVGNQVSLTGGIADNGSYQGNLEASNTEEIPETGTVRTTLKLARDPSYDAANHSPYDDSWQNAAAYLRFDSPVSTERSYTVTASIFHSDANQVTLIPTLSSPFTSSGTAQEISKGAHVYGEYTKDLEQDSSITYRSYIDYTDSTYAGYNPQFTDASFESQYDTVIFGDWKTNTGVGYRFTQDNIASNGLLITTPDSRFSQFFDAFVQTKVPLVEHELFATFGLKYEANSYNPFAMLPSVKLAWEPHPLFMGWLSWSRAQRIPSRNTFHLRTYLKGTPGGYVAYIPSEEFKSEQLEAYEAGVRINPLSGLHIDSTVFLNHYRDLRTFVPGPAYGAPIAVPLYISNQGYAYTRGIETVVTYQTSPQLRLTGSYAYHDLNFKADPGVTDSIFLSSANKWAKHAYTGQVSYLISDNLTFNTAAVYYSKQAAANIPAYLKLNTNIAWQATDGVDIIFGIDNLTDNMHPEYSAPLYGVATEVPRIIYTTVRITSW